MKVGIITFHEAANYGAVLQTYALQKYLDKIEIDNEIINYRCDAIYDMYVPWCNKRIKSLNDFLKAIIRYSIRKQKQKRFQDFVERNIRLGSKNVIRNDEIENQDFSQYNLILVGSDQVWNPYITQWDTRYFLDFLPNNIKKGSYASSFGISNLSEDYQEKIKPLLSEFDCLSVREEQGKEIIRNLIEEKEIKVTVDPTLLLSKDEWFEGEKERDYILLYLLEESYEAKRFARNLANETGLPIYCISDSVFRSIKVKYITKATPEEWVILFKNAKYVVTNSFHGTIFSINFHVSFFVDVLKGVNKSNSRILNLLEKLGLNERMISNSELLVNPDIQKWKQIDIKLKEMKKESFEYLETICNTNDSRGI